MTLRLVIEHASHPQREREKLHPGGEFSIGRGAECSWQLEDPDQFVSRKHCVISGGPGRWLVTDASRGGLFIDGRDQPLGPGNSAPLESGMRLRLGDVVIRVETLEAATPAPRPAHGQPAARSLGGDGFFSAPVVPLPPVQRPEGLPTPFDAPRAAMAPQAAQSRPVPPPAFDDPFTLDPVATPNRTAAAPAPPRPAPLFADPFASTEGLAPAAEGPSGSAPAASGDFSFGSFFDDAAPTAATSAGKGMAGDDWGLPAAAPALAETLPPHFAPPPHVAPPPRVASPPAASFDDWELPGAMPVAPAPAAPEAPAAPLQTEPERSRARAMPPVAPPEVEPSAVEHRETEPPAPAIKSPAPPAQPPAPAPQPPAPSIGSPAALPPLPEGPREGEANRVAPQPHEAMLIEALFRGLGLAGAEAATPEQMEAVGKRFRMLIEGLMHMLRTRAREKQNVRVAQTIIGSADVNPLKFAATTDDALAAVIAPRGAGYLPPDAAIAAAFRDLADHQVRTWVGMQSALRQMIDRFDPAAIEAEIESAGLIKALLAGGRNAKLWQLYTDRYKDIARSAEDRFLGEVGADFRDAYEGNRRKADDPQT